MELGARQLRIYNILCIASVPTQLPSARILISLMGHRGLTAHRSIEFTTLTFLLADLGREMPAYIRLNIVCCEFDAIRTRRMMTHTVPNTMASHYWEHAFDAIHLQLENVILY